MAVKKLFPIRSKKSSIFKGGVEPTKVHLFFRKLNAFDCRTADCRRNNEQEEHIERKEQAPYFS
jgi:hypothetical protein